MKNKRKKINSDESKYFFLFISPWLFGFLVFTLFSTFFTLFMSFTSWNMFQTPTFVGLQNYKEVLTDPIFILAVKHTFIYTIIAVPLNIVLSIGLAYLLTLPMKRMAVFRTIFYLPALVPIVASTMLFQMILAPTGLLNQVLGLVGINGPAWLISEKYVLFSFVWMSVWSVGGSMVLIISAIHGISNDLYESAMIEGASRLKMFKSITLPLISPIIFFNFITGLIGSLQTFSQVYLLTHGGPNNASIMIAPYLYNEAFQNYRFGYASAVSMILFVMIIILTAFIFKKSAVFVYYESEVKKHAKKAV